MTQSKDDDTITISISDYMYSSSDDVNLDSINISTTIDDVPGGYFIGADVQGDITFNGVDYNYSGNFIDPSDVENMCKEYPALSKVWQNFKSVYDMVLQDYKGKQKAGEVKDDDIPF